jgi:signal transduction histidine kinase
MSRPPVVVRDAALALAVATVGAVDVLVSPAILGTHLVGPPWAVWISLLIAEGAIALRRVRPGWAFALMGLALAGQSVTLGTSTGNGALIPALVLSYSVAVYGARRSAVAALCAIPAVSAVREIFNPGNATAAQVFNGIGWDLTLVGAWLLGAYVRTRRQLVAELRQRASDSARAAAAAERARIAREMHDVLAHSLGVIVVQAEAAEEALQRRPHLAGASLQAIQRTGRDALVEIRRLVDILREGEAGRQPVPGAAAIEELVQAVIGAGLPVELEVHGSVHALPAAHDLAVYRIVQESLTNTLKHARASRARVRIECLDDRLSVEVVDDGHGVPSGRQTDPGNGLRGMRERVAAVGGTFSAGPTGDRGFCVRAVLNLREPS